jgi:hypothetical protein
MAAQRVHAATRQTDITQQKLHHRHRADVLCADRMLRPAQGEQAGQRLVRRRRGGKQTADLQVLILRRAADARHHLGRVPVYMFAE